MASGRIGDGLVDQHDRDIVPDRVNAPALPALKTLSFVFQHKRLFADGADQDVEQVLGNHGEDFTPFLGERRKSLTAKIAKDRKGTTEDFSSSRP
jgi:hypothetical protein